MRKKTIRRTTALAVSVAAVLGTSALAASAAGAATARDHDHSRHVLLISVDGMHQSDLDWYIATHPNSTLARLTRSGSEYTNASTSNPSDSDPGGTALMTGGNPRSTGVFYDVEYSHTVDEAVAGWPGVQAAPGSSVVWLYSTS